MNSTPIMSIRLVPNNCAYILIFFSFSLLLSCHLHLSEFIIVGWNIDISLSLSRCCSPHASRVRHRRVLWRCRRCVAAIPSYSFFFLVCSVFTLLLVNIIFLISVFLTSRQISPCCLHLVQILPLYKAMLPDALSAAALLGQVGGPHTTFFLINIYVSTQSAKILFVLLTRPPSHVLRTFHISCLL